MTKNKLKVAVWPTFGKQKCVFAQCIFLTQAGAAVLAAAGDQGLPNVALFIQPNQTDVSQKMSCFGTQNPQKLAVHMPA
jgi:hypothetical protein